MKVQQTKTNSLGKENSSITSILSIKYFVTIIGLILLSITSTRNALFWYIKSFWVSSGIFWQKQWDSTLSLFNHNEFSLHVLGTFIITFTIYWFVGLLYTAMDLTGKPSYLLKYKIQDNTKVTFKQVISVLKQVLFNQIAIGVPFLWIGYYITVWRKCDDSPKLPTFQKLLYDLLICILIEEIGFYYAHRLLHDPRIYKYIHKKHHEWTAPIAITAAYCHPIEHIFANIFPIFLGPLLLGSHLSLSWLWFTIAILSTLNSHSGFHFPFFLSPELHDFHHLKFNCNYGVLGILDRLHGTDAMFRKSKSYERDVTLFSLVPIKQIFPDNQKNE